MIELKDHCKDKKILKNTNYKRVILDLYESYMRIIREGKGRETPRPRGRATKESRPRGRGCGAKRSKGTPDKDLSLIHI